MILQWKNELTSTVSRPMAFPVFMLRMLSSKKSCKYQNSNLNFLSNQMILSCNFPLRRYAEKISYCSFGVNVGYLECRFKGMLRRFAQNRSDGERWTSVDVDFTVRHRAFGIRFRAIIGSRVQTRGIETLKAYDPLKATLQPKPTQNFCNMNFIRIREHLFRISLIFSIYSLTRSKILALITC